MVPGRAAAGDSLSWWGLQLEQDALSTAGRVLPDVSLREQGTRDAVVRSGLQER